MAGKDPADAFSAWTGSLQASLLFWIWACLIQEMVAGTFEVVIGGEDKRGAPGGILRAISPPQGINDRSY